MTEPTDQASDLPYSDTQRVPIVPEGGVARGEAVEYHLLSFRQMDTLRAQLAEVTAERDALQAELERVKEERAAMDATIADYQKENAHLQALCKDKEGHLNGYRRAADEDRGQIKRLREDMKYIALLCTTEKEDEFRHTLQVDILTIAQNAMKDTEREE